MNDDQIRDLRRLYGRTDDVVLARRLKTTPAQVRATAAELHLAKDKAAFPGVTMPRWTEAQVAILRHEYPRCSNLDLARALGRTVKSVVSKAHALGLRKNPDRLQEMGRQNVRKRYDRIR